MTWRAMFGRPSVEERLYWLLIRIYRSPAVLFEFTRTPEGDTMPERPGPHLRADRPAAQQQRGGLSRRTTVTATAALV